MPYCSKCGAELPENARYCSTCGALTSRADVGVEAYSRIDRVTSIPELDNAHYERGQYTGRINKGSGKLIVETTTGSITIHHQSGGLSEES